MNRERSRSRLSNVASKQKIKQTISKAMGRKIQQPIILNKPVRSQSTKSLRSYNVSTIQLGGTSIKNKSQLLHKSKFVDLGEKQSKVKYWEWWHQKNAELITQQKVKETKGKKEYLKYFAMEEPERKKIIIAIQNYEIYPGYPQLRILCIEQQRLLVQQIKESSVLKVPISKLPLYYLIFEPKEQKKVEAIEQGIKNILKNKKNKIFDEFMKKSIEGFFQINFFLLIKFEKEEPKKSVNVKTLQQVLKTNHFHTKLY